MNLRLRCIENGWETSGKSSSDQPEVKEELSAEEVLLTWASLLIGCFPGYTIRLPTEKELEMNFSKEVKKVRLFESTLLTSYKINFRVRTQYMSRSNSEASSYLKDDCLSIHCTVRVQQEQTRVEEGRHYVIPVPPSDMSQNLKGFLKSGVGSDSTFQVGNEFFDPFTFKAMLLFLYLNELPETHELSDLDSLYTSTTIAQHLLDAADGFVLNRLKLMCEAKLCEEISASTVADTLAQDNTNSRTGTENWDVRLGNPDMKTVVIEEFDPFAFKAMLLFLYSDELPEAHELSDSESVCTSTTLMRHLLAATDRFDLARLKLMCEAKLYEDIAANTVADTLSLAERYQCPELKTACLNFAAKSENLGEVMKSDGYSHVEKWCPSLLTDLLKKCMQL
ncbi:hypothetical protein MKW98_000144 [Papaver atlanticum]|uniref:BTB domain-containing protein n=1 Tax=Papaver atlanticum TaxID=357466 RepID=A0AAD4XHS4_9MAGN|nr:hypothetical protein MKW98_000144 [Papaver atlanticum]